MIRLDTDHTAFLKYPESERGRRMIDRLNAVEPSDHVAAAIVTVEERMRGWLAVIAKEKSDCGSRRASCWRPVPYRIHRRRHHRAIKRIVLRGRTR